MADGGREPGKRERKDELSKEKLEADRGGALPDREALSVLNADVSIPADPAIAAEVLAGDDASGGESPLGDESAGEAPPADES